MGRLSFGASDFTSVLKGICGDQALFCWVLVFPICLSSHFGLSTFDISRCYSKLNFFMTDDRVYAILGYDL